MIGKVLFGWIVDWLPKRAALWLASGLQAVGVTLLFVAESYPFLLAAGAVFGLGMGGIIPIWGASIGAGFGRHAFGRVMGLMSPLMLPIHVFGIPYAGLVYDRTGSYDIAFITFLGIYALAMIATLFLQLPETEPGSEPVPEPVAASTAGGVADSRTCATG